MKHTFFLCITKQFVVFINLCIKFCNTISWFKMQLLIDVLNKLFNIYIKRLHQSELIINAIVFQTIEDI